MTFLMPDGKPAPSLMTEDEVIEFLRIDGCDAKRSLKHLRETKRMPAVRIGKRLKYRPDKIMEWVDSLEE